MILENSPVKSECRAGQFYPEWPMSTNRSCKRHLSLCGIACRCCALYVINNNHATVEFQNISNNDSEITFGLSEFQVIWSN